MPEEQLPGDGSEEPSSVLESTQAARVLLGRTGSIGYARMLTLSDGVFAIALTLLVLNFKTPTDRLTDAGLAHTLLAQGNTLFSYLLSILIIGRYWIAHHQMFQHIRGFDVPLAMLNLAFVGSVAFLPFPTSVLGQYGGTTGAVFYAGTIFLIGIAELAEWIYAWRFHHPHVEPIADDVGRFFALSIARVPVIFALSIPVAFANATAAEIMWAAIAVPAFALRRRRRALARAVEDAE